MKLNLDIPLSKYVHWCGLWSGFKCWRLQRKLKRNPRYFLALAQACVEVAENQENREQQEAWAANGKQCLEWFKEMEKP